MESIVRSSTATTEAGKPPGTARRRLATLGVALLVGAGVAGVSAAPAFARDLGGVSMENACLTQYGSSYHAEVARDDAFGWACFNRPDNFAHSIDVDRECRNEYGPAARSTYYDRWNPYSWYCVD